MNILLLIGTRKGAFLAWSDKKRKTWNLEGPLLKGAEVNDIVLDQRGAPTMYAAATSYWFGSTVQRSSDYGKTWMQSEGGVRFSEGSDKKVERVWCIGLPPAGSPQDLYAGVDPGALFRSADGGMTWKEVESLTSHPTRMKWMPGAGGLMVHSIAFHPKDPKRFYVGISAAGVFATENGGKSWEPRNKGVLADFMADKYPEVGQCVHHLELHPAKPDVLYQQNHCGVYRSDDAGRTWKDISKGLPSRFGFPIQIHPHDPKTVYVIPEVGPEFRATPSGSFTVHVSADRGRTWKKLTRGLPQKNAFIHVHRQAMAVDPLQPHGLYVGTSTGTIYASRSEGRSWEPVLQHLPHVTSLRTAVLT